jgi:hypothetical protein
LEQVLQASEEGWTGLSMQLKLDHGMERALPVEQYVANFLSECTGERSLGELIELLLPGKGPEAERVRSGCIAAMRLLMRQGFMRVSGPEQPATDRKP